MTTTDRPLATFALFAYNQEKYIREAVEGAFAQTYEPLEIILSDDCSSDRTFEIMQEMAAEYRGPHIVKLRRNQINLGTASHVQSVAEAMSGELLVVAAGDDISVPERTSVLVDLWLESGKEKSVLHSGAESFFGFDTTARTVMPLRVPDTQKLDVAWLLRHRGNPTMAPTAAYARSIFTQFPPLIGGSIIEDGPLSFRGFLAGGFASSPAALVWIRKLPETSGTGHSIKNLGRWNRFIRSRIISSFSRIQDLNSAVIDDRARRALESYLIYNIKSLSKCIFTQSSCDTLIGKIRTIVSILIYYPAGHGIKGRIDFALRFSKLVDDGQYKRIKNSYRYLMGK